MTFRAIAEIITCQITLYALLSRVFNGNVKRAYIFCPIFSLCIITILSLLKNNLTNIYQSLFFIFDIFLYFVFPLVLVQNIKKSKIFYTSLTVVGLFSLINVSCSFIATLINPIFSYANILNIVIEVILTLIITTLSFCKKFSDVLLNILAISKSVKIVMLLFIWELLILVTSLTVLLSQYSKNPIVALACFLIFIILIVSCIVLYLLIINNLKSTYYKSINATIQNNINEQVRHYERLYVANENLRKFRHDYNNLKIGLNSYLQNKDIDGAILYLDECDKITETEDIIYHTGHHIVDALLSDKANTIKENNIHIIFNGLIPSDILTPVDLCIIFGNTLDNAIEACLKIENDTVKNINVTVKQNYDYVFVTITNPTPTNIKIKNNNILTTKKDNELHGIGLSSIKQILKKYDGHLLLSCEHNIFTTELDFCISSNMQLK